MHKEISILLSADEQYARCCAVTILSVLSNTSVAQNIHFYVLTPDFSSVSIQKIEELCSSFRAQVSFVPVNLSLFESFPAFHSHFNQNNYSRIYGPDLCQSCDRLIYLDCDLIVLADVAELFEYDLQGNVVGAVPHVQLPYQQTFIETFPVSGHDIYFNSGVMLIDADRWRKEKCAEAILSLASEHANQLHFADQDVFNVYFWQKYCHLSGLWNVEARLYKERLLGLPQSPEITQRLQSPKIIHYTGGDKPWSSKQYVSKREVCLEYSDRLSRLIGWQVNSEVRSCNPLNLVSFIYSCCYFRASSLVKAIKI